jgi:hypothetical protein
MRTLHFLAVSLVLLSLVDAFGQPQEAERYQDDRKRSPLIGQPPRVASPEIVQQMKQRLERSEFGSGLTPAELNEIKKLREADIALLNRIIETDRKYKELVEYINGLNDTLDARLLTQAIDDIKQLKQEQQDRLETEKTEHERNMRMVGSIKTGTIMLVIGMVVHWVKWMIFDPKRRKALLNAMQRQTEEVKHKDCTEFEREYRPHYYPKEGSDD